MQIRRRQEDGTFGPLEEVFEASLDESTMALFDEITSQQEQLTTQLAENLNKQFVLKSNNGFAILEQNLENKVSEHIAEHGYNWFVDRIITNFDNKLVDDLRINGKSLYRKTDGTLSTTWSDESTIQHLDTQDLNVKVKNGGTTVKTINYQESVKLKGINGISDQLLKDKIVRNIGSVGVNQKTYTQNDVLSQTSSEIVLRIDTDIDNLNPRYMVEGIRDRGNSGSGSGVYFSKTFKCLAIALTSTDLTGITGANLLSKANEYFKTRVVTVIFNKKTPLIENNNSTFPSFYFSGDMNITNFRYYASTVNVSGKTYTQADVLFSTEFELILRIESNISELDTSFSVTGIGKRINDADTGVYYSTNHKTLAIKLTRDKELNGIVADTLVDRANIFFSTNPINVTYNAQGLEDDGSSKTLLSPVVEAKVVCNRKEIKDFIHNENGVKYNGHLKTIDAQLCNSKGKPIQLKGIGTHHLLQYEDLQTFEAIKTLKYYGIDILRLSAYVTDRNYIKTTPSLGLGYINSVTETRARMDELIDYCKQLDMYCIVDWHTFADEYILDYTQTAKSFFNYFAQKYPNDPYLLWEFTNEPFYETSDDMASFIAQVAPEVLATNPDAIMLTGVNEDSLVTLYNKIQNAITLPNLFLSKHWYVGMYLDRGYEQGKANIDIIVDSIVSAKLPFFVTEWGNSMPSGNGARFDEMAEYFVRKLKNNGISWATWKLTHQDMTTSLLKYSEDRDYLKYGGWVDSDFSEYGKITMTYFTDK